MYLLVTPQEEPVIANTTKQDFQSNQSLNQSMHLFRTNLVLLTCGLTSFFNTIKTLE